MSSITNDLSPLIPAATAPSIAGPKESSPGIRPYSIIPTAPFDDGVHAYAQTSGHDRTKRDTGSNSKSYWNHENGADTHTDGDGTVVARTPIQSPVGIRTDYSNYSLDEFLGQLGTSLKDPFGELAKQIVTVDGGSPEKIDQAKQIGSQITNVLSLGTGPKGAILQAIGGTLVGLQNTAKGRPLTVDDLQDLSQQLKTALKSPAAQPDKSSGPQDSPVSQEKEKKEVKAGSDTSNTTDPSTSFPDMQNVQFNGKEYFAANAPDTADGFYLLRMPNPEKSSELVSSGIIAKPDEAGNWRRRGVEGGGPVFSKQLAFSDQTTPQEAQKLVDSTQSINYVGGDKGYVYKGMVFRGDMRPREVIFQDGFKLRTPITDINQVNGFRGGFGGGKDALDPDGMGISTSAFYQRAGAGAFYYGGNKGGHTFVIDGRNLEGFHLYANRHLQEHPGDTRIKLLPWEINYGTDIPGTSVVGAFDKAGKFTPNPNYKGN
ncbi:hypothetical protein ACFFJT_01595 [Dyella flava]|uniref:Uncharacterized protein n=1 Tax=Dyella flava TaxID=1920170 RepID=A0ABS2K563_9GAMM|nr:hypothetical protein [Dyella flava]MBM7126309.1 hypothetical protein [Dyella flava]GLQ48887.1 hypothetical protein GCM10010872_03360 [Dyella flava]